MRDKKVVLALLMASLMGSVAFAQYTTSSSAEDGVRKTVQQFEQGISQRDPKKIEGVVAEDLVVLENGHRNDGWADFRDHHLLPEMKEPAPPSKTELVKVKATDQIGWAYTKTEMKLTRKSGERVDARLWSVYVLEKRQGNWKIVLLDWSFYVPRPAGS